MHLVLIILALVAGFAFLLSTFFPDALSSREGKMDVVHAVLIAVFLISSLVLGRRWQMKQMLPSALIWLVLILGLVLVYSYMPGIQERFEKTLLPSKPVVTEQGAVEIRAAENGHFYVDAEVNGKPVRFMIDTGASDIVLSKEAAQRLGIYPEESAFNKVYSTANGIVKGAPIVLDEISVGPVQLQNIRASVNGGEMSSSLLGLTFLNEINGYAIRGNVLILYP